MLELIVGVYKIVCLINNKLYIGSSYNIKNRISIHKYKLKAGKHENIHLQRAWNKYGEDNFKFEVVEECLIEVLRLREQDWINSLKVCDVNIGYNICKIVGKPGAKIDEDTVMRIKYDLSYGVDVKEIAIKYSIPDGTINTIKYLISWDYILPELNEKITSFVNTQKSRLDIDAVMLIKTDMSNGIDINTIESKFNISHQTALNIRNLTNWRECLFELNEIITNFRTDIGKNKTLKIIKMRSYCEKCGEVIYKTNNKQKFCTKCAKGNK